MKIAGLDIGTTGCKLTVFDAAGKQLDRAYADYPAQRAGGQQEIDAGAILISVLQVIGRMAAQYPDIAGIGVTSFGESCVLADGTGQPLCRAMLYTDSRGAAECQVLTRKLGARRIAAICGTAPHEMYSLPKLMWLKAHRPELWERARHIFLMEDFVVFALTGVAQIDYSLAARTLGFDIRGLAWSPELWAAAGIDPGLLSKPVPSGTPAGPITAAVASQTGLAPGTQIVSISHDQVAAAVGAGVFSPEAAVDGAGTVECITPVYEGIPDMEVMMAGSYAVVPYVVPGKYVCYAFSYTGGSLIQWCVDTLAKKEKALAAAEGLTVNAYLERQAASPTGLLVLPHFAGAATPYMDTGAKGAILGLTLDTTAAEIYRACMEGVVYEMLLNLERLKASGIRFTRLQATGGGAHSPVWMQMKADALGLPIVSLATVDAGTVGSAMLTGIALGCFADLADAAHHMVVPVHTYIPDAARHEAYQKVYERYRRVYEAVRPLME